MTRRLALLATIAALSAAGAAVAAGPLDLYYERTLIVAANERCRLFPEDVSAALLAAQVQARGAALRGGAAEADTSRTFANARARAAGLPCDSPDLAIIGQRVRKAFAGFSRLQRMTYPGDANRWDANRATNPDTIIWRLSQSVAFGRDRAVFGLAGRGVQRQVMAAATFADGAWPYAARLVIRNPGRAGTPPDIRLKSGSPLAGRTAPRQSSHVILAEARNLAEAGVLPRGAKTGILFRFPADTVTKLQALDPREAVMLEFMFQGRGADQVRTAYIEVGDFSAGQAFLKVPRR